MDDREQNALRYRFGGYRYSLRSPDTYGPDDYIPEESGLYPFPHPEADESSSSESSDS